jgi:hypothetical protein
MLLVSWPCGVSGCFHDVCRLPDDRTTIPRRVKSECTTDEETIDRSTSIMNCGLSELGCCDDLSIQMTTLHRHTVILNLELLRS